MTNLQKAAEQGNQAAPNLLDAIRAGEIGGGGGNSSDVRSYVKAIANTKQDLETLVASIFEENANSNILGFVISDTSLFVYSNYKDWLDPLISYMNTYIEYMRSDGGSDEETAQYLALLSYIESAKTTIPLNTVYELSDDTSFIIANLAEMNVFPTLGFMQVVTLENGNARSLSVFKLGTVYDQDFPVDTVIAVNLTIYIPILPLYVNSNYNTGEVVGYGNSRVCYVDAGALYDQVIADISDMPDAPDIIRSNDVTRYDAFIIKGISSGATATLACVYSLDILSTIDEAELSSELRAKLAMYKDSVEAEPDKYVCTSDADLCKHIEACSCFMNIESNFDEFGPRTRENIIRRVVSSNGSDAYSYVSTSQLFAGCGFAESEYNTSSGSGTYTYYMPSPLK